MPPRPSANTGLRLPPFAREDLRSIVAALEARGESVRLDDLVGVLLHRAAALAQSAEELDKLGQEIRAHKARSKKEGF